MALSIFFSSEVAAAGAALGRDSKNTVLVIDPALDPPEMMRLVEELLGPHLKE